MTPRRQIGYPLALVTGGGGWLGRRWIRWLREQAGPDLRLRCLVLPGSAPFPAEDRVEIVEGDLRSAEDCRRLCDGGRGALLVHIAGVIHPRRVRDFYDINVRGTENALDAAVRGGVRRIVAVSSNSPFGCNPRRDHRFDEEAPYHPYRHYGRSKMRMEQAVRSRKDAMEAVIVRAPWFYGPGQPARQTQFFRMIRRGRVPLAGDGQNRRSMAYLDNLCQGLYLAGTHPRAPSQAYWIADAEPYSMMEIVRTIRRVLEKDFGLPCVDRIIRLPSLLSGMASAADILLQGMGLYHTSIHVLSEMNKTIACSVEKARRELGYAPEVALEEGMRRSIQWCLDAGEAL